MMTQFNIEEKIKGTPEVPDAIPQIASLILSITKQAENFGVSPNFLFALLDKMGATKELPKLPKTWKNIAKICARFGYSETFNNKQMPYILKNDDEIVYKVMMILENYLASGQEDDQIPPIDLVSDTDFIFEVSMAVYKLYPPNNLGEAVNEIFAINDDFVQLLAVSLTFGRALGASNIQFE